MYSVKEIYYTLQGEGFHTGRAAVFLRFSGCNLWNGLEKDRHDAICKFCDTDFWGTDGENGGKYQANILAKKCLELWPSNSPHKPFIVCTGGEPLLQLDNELIQELHSIGFEIAIESNGTIEVPEGVDWTCISPKSGADLIVLKGDELKLVFPQNKIDLTFLESLDFTFHYLQPMDGPELSVNTKKCLEVCLSNPKWKLSVQTHKIIGIP